MGYVTPSTAAALASRVYSVHDQFELKTFLSRDEFSKETGGKHALTAKVGSRLLNTTDGFGVCARGVGKFENDIFLIFRGSTFANYGADWLTNT